MSPTDRLLVVLLMRKRALLQYYGMNAQGLGAALDTPTLSLNAYEQLRNETMLEVWALETAMRLQPEGRPMLPLLTGERTG